MKRKKAGTTCCYEAQRSAINGSCCHIFETGVNRDLPKTSVTRPGTRVPIQFASQEKINAHPELAEDFVHRILELDWAWISDASSLWDFHRDETNDTLISEIKEAYSVDVSDIESARLSEILEGIAATPKST